MTTDDLIGAFGRFGLSVHPSTAIDEHTAQQITTVPRRHPHHEITFDFPALHLLSDARYAYLPPPFNIDQRARPDLTKYYLSAFPLQHCHIMDPHAVQDDLPVLQCNEHIAAFLTILDSLAGYPGESKLSIATYMRGKRTRFSIALTSMVRGKSNIYQADFDEEELSFALSARRPWTELLGDVVYRGSARSYFAAEARMLAQDLDLHKRDWERWRGQWRCAKHVDGHGDMSHMKCADVEVLESKNGEYFVISACGHMLQTDAAEIHALREGCRDRVQCADCDDQAAWESLDGDVEQDELAVVSARALAGILIATARSFEMPDEIAPSATQHAYCEETATALFIMCTWLDTREDMITIVPAALVAGLEKVCMDGLRRDCNLPQTSTVPTPPGWTKFLNMWLGRAVNFLTRRRCSVHDSEDHAGVHWHADDNLIWWRDPRQFQRRDLSDSEPDVDSSDISMS